MCGIAGIVGTTPTREQLTKMADAIVHRGPDDDGFHIEEGVGLAFRRLSIVDLESGQQPLSNEDGTVHVVFNGEIYDHALLRAELEARGHKFRTHHADSEVMVHGWVEWGHGLFDRLNGMFAVAIWDARERTLVLARDRYGIKPLYFAFDDPELDNGTMVFGSEIRTLHASGLLPSAPSGEGILEYFSFQNVWREQTMFAGVRQLDAGCSLTWRDGKVQQRRYWDIEFTRSRTGSLDSLAEEHRDVLQRSIQRQIAADVPVMSYLSGGIDSTAITVVSHQHDPNVRAYSCIFNLDGVGKDAHVDEREFSRLVAEEYDLDRVELELSQDSLVGCIGDYVEALEDLRMGMGYPVYLISQRVAQDAKVVLSGTGGDEFHAGYVARYTILGDHSGSARAPAAIDRLGQGLRRLFSFLPGVAPPAAPPEEPGVIYRRVLNAIFNKEQLQNVFTSDFLSTTNGYDASSVMDDTLAKCPSENWWDRVMYVDAKTYLHGLLVLEDKLSMAHSLETRVPLLDNELIDFLLDVPFDALIQEGVGKVLFREAVKPWVPDSIYKKPKMGFGPPDGSWYRNTLRTWIEGNFDAMASRSECIFRREFLRGLLDDHFSQRADNTYLIWSLLNFEHWCQRFSMFGATPSSRPIPTTAS